MINDAVIICKQFIIFVLHAAYEAKCLYKEDFLPLQTDPVLLY